jgi:hypothetical protein
MAFDFFFTFGSRTWLPLPNGGYCPRCTAIMLLDDMLQRKDFVRLRVRGIQNTH